MVASQLRPYSFQVYDPNFYSGHYDGKPTHYLQELRYKPPPPDVGAGGANVPSQGQFLPLEYGFIEQQEGTFSFEGPPHHRRPHQRSRLKELHTDSLKLQKRRQKLRPSDMGVHGDAAVPAADAPAAAAQAQAAAMAAPAETVPRAAGAADNKVPSSPSSTAGFENPNFDYAAAENSRRLREQQLKQKLLEQKTLLMQKQGDIHQQQQPQPRQKKQQPVLVKSNAASQPVQANRTTSQANKQAEVFVNNYALDYENQQHQQQVHSATGAPQNFSNDREKQRYFASLQQQQQYWRQQEETMLEKERLKHQRQYNRQQEQLYHEQLYRKALEERAISAHQQPLLRQHLPQEMMHPQIREQMHPHDHHHHHRKQYPHQQMLFPQDQTPPTHPQTLAQTPEQPMKPHPTRESDSLKMKQYRLLQEELKRRQEFVRKKQLQEEEKLAAKPSVIPFHSPETVDEFMEDSKAPRETSANIPEQNAPRDNRHFKATYNESGKRERDNKHRDKHSKKRHKRHKTDKETHKENKPPSAVPMEVTQQKLDQTEPKEPERSALVESKVTHEKQKEEAGAQKETEQASRLEMLRRDHRQQTAYYKEWNTTEEQSFARYAMSRMLYDRCVKEMKGLHSSPNPEAQHAHPRSVRQLLRRDSSRSDTSSVAPAQSDTSEASTGELQQTQGGIFFAHGKHRGSVDSAEVATPPASLDLSDSRASSSLRSPNSDEINPDLLQDNSGHDVINQQHVLSASEEDRFNSNFGQLGNSAQASFEDVDQSLRNYMDWLQSEEARQKRLLSGVKDSFDKSEDRVVELTQPEKIRTEADAQSPPKLAADLKASELPPNEEVTEVENWESNGTVYSVYNVTKAPTEDSETESVELSPQVLAVLESFGQEQEEMDERKEESSSTLDTALAVQSLETEAQEHHAQPPEKTMEWETDSQDPDVKFYISSSSEFLDHESRSTGSYKVSEEELNLEYTPLDEAKEALAKSRVEGKEEALLQVPAADVNLASSDGDESGHHLDESLEETRFERALEQDDYESSSDEAEEVTRDPSVDIEEEVDDILENIEVETYSPTSTLSKAFTHPKKKKTHHRMKKHVPPPDMVPIVSAGSSEMTSSTGSNQEMFLYHDLLTTNYRNLTKEATASDDDEEEEDAQTIEAVDDVEAESDEHQEEEATKQEEEEDTEEEDVGMPGPSPEDAFEVVVEAATEESYGSDWPSDHDEFIPKVIKGKNKKSATDMFIYDFYHEKLNQKRTSSCEAVADGGSVGRISDLGSDDLEKTSGEEALKVPETSTNLMASSMTSSNLSDGSSLDQIIGDTMQLTERILSSSEDVRATSDENISGVLLGSPKDLEDEKTGQRGDSTEEEQQISEIDERLPTYADIEKLREDTRRLEELSQLADELVSKLSATQQIERITPSETCEEEQVSEDDDEFREESIDIDTAVVCEDPAGSLAWTQDTVSKSSMSSLDTAEIIHVIDDIPENEIYDPNEVTDTDDKSEKSEEAPKAVIRSESPNISDAEVVLDTGVPAMEEHFFSTSAPKDDESTRCLTTKSVDHRDVFMPGEVRACSLEEPLYVNREVFMPQSPMVARDPEDEHFLDVSSSDFDTKSFEELERLIALEEKAGVSSVSQASPLPQARIVLKEEETLESAILTRVVREEPVNHAKRAVHRASLEDSKAPSKLKVLALKAVRQGKFASHRSSPKSEVVSSREASGLESNEGIKSKVTWNVSHVDWSESDAAQPARSLAVRRQQGLLNKDAEFESVTSDRGSDTVEAGYLQGTHSDSVVEDSDSSSVSLADRPKMDYLKPGVHAFNDDSSISDLFPDSDSEPLDDDVFLSDSGWQEPEGEQSHWNELVTDKSSHVVSVEAPNLLSDTQAESFLRHMLGIHEQHCCAASESAAADDVTERAELEEDFSACLSDVYQAVTSESESEAGEVLSEEVHSQEVTLVFAWPKDKSLPSPYRKQTHEGKPYREIHVRKVTRVKDFDVEIMEGPKIMYTNKKSALDGASATQAETPEGQATKPEDESEKLDVACESGVLSGQEREGAVPGEDLHHPEASPLRPENNLDLDELIQNLSDISSELDSSAGEKSVEVHDKSEAWNIHAIPLRVSARPDGRTPSTRSSVSSGEAGGAKPSAGTHEDSRSDVVAEVEQTDVDVVHDDGSSEAQKHGDVAQHGGEVDSTAVETVSSTKPDREDEDPPHSEADGQKKPRVRRTIIVTAVLRPKSELEREKGGSKNVCPVKHCATCKSLMHVKKVARKGKNVASNCMKCSQLMNERRVNWLHDKTSSTCDIVTAAGHAVSDGFHTWPLGKGRGTAAPAPPAFAAEPGEPRHKQEESSPIEAPSGACQSATTTHCNTNVSTSVAKSNPQTSTPTQASGPTDPLLCEASASDPPPTHSSVTPDVKAAESPGQSHVSVETAESDVTNDTSSSVDTVVATVDSTNTGPHSNTCLPPQNPPADVPPTDKRGTRLRSEESVDSDTLEVLVEGYGSDTEELLGEIELELNRHIPAPVLTDTSEEGRIARIPDTPRAEALECIAGAEPDLQQEEPIYSPPCVLSAFISDESACLSPTQNIDLVSSAGRSKVCNGAVWKIAEAVIPQVKRRSACVGSRERVRTDKLPRLSCAPIEEEVELPEDEEIGIATVTSEESAVEAGTVEDGLSKPVETAQKAGAGRQNNAKLPAVSETNQNTVGTHASVTEYVGKGLLSTEVMKLLPYLFPQASQSQEKSVPALQFATDMTIAEPADFQTCTTLPCDPDKYCLLSTRYIDVCFSEAPLTLEDPIWTVTRDCCPDADCPLFEQAADLFWFGTGTEQMQWGVDVATPELHIYASSRWEQTAEPRAVPSPLNQILILEDTFIGGYSAVESEVTRVVLTGAESVGSQTLHTSTTPCRAIANSQAEPTDANVSIITRNIAHSHHHSAEPSSPSLQQREQKDKTVAVAEALKDSISVGENTSELEVKQQAITDELIAEALSPSSDEDSLKAAESDTETPEKTSTAWSSLKRLVSDLVETALQGAKEKLRTILRERNSSSEPESIPDETAASGREAGKEQLEWKINQDESEENKVWKGNPVTMTDNDENRIWKGNPGTNSANASAAERVIPVMQKDKTAPVAQSELVTPRETADNVSIVDIGEVRESGARDRSLRSDAIAGARLVWMDYRGPRRYYNEPSVPPFQETEERVLQGRVSQSEGEEEQEEDIRRIKEDIITMDKSGKFKLPPSALKQERPISTDRQEPKPKKEMSIRIPVQVIKSPSGQVEERRSEPSRQEQSSNQRQMAPYGEVLPDLLQSDTSPRVGGFRTFNFGKGDEDKEVREQEEFSSDGGLSRRSKMTTTTQHSGKHSECSFSTQGTIEDIPVFGALFSGVQDGSRPGPDHKSVQQAFDNLFGTEPLPELDSSSGPDWQVTTEEKADIERVTYTDDEAKQKKVKILDYKMETSEEVSGDVPKNLKSIHEGAKAIQDIARHRETGHHHHPAVREKPVERFSRRGLAQGEAAAAVHGPPLSPTLQSDDSPSRRRRLTPKASPRRRRRLVIPPHQQYMHEDSDSTQRESPSRTEIIRGTRVDPSPPRTTRQETYEEIRRDQRAFQRVQESSKAEEIRTQTRSDEVGRPQSKVIPITVIHGGRSEQTRTTQAEAPKDEIKAEPRVVETLETFDTEVESITQHARTEDEQVIRKPAPNPQIVRENIAKETYIEPPTIRKQTVSDDISRTQFVEPNREEEKCDIFEHPKPEMEMTCDVVLPEPSPEPPEPETPKTPAEHGVFEVFDAENKKVEADESQYQREVPIRVKPTADVEHPKRFQEVLTEKTDKTDIFESEREMNNMRSVDRPQKKSREAFEREMDENQKPAVEVSPKYYRAGADPSSEDSPERQIFCDDVAGARLILKEQFGPSAFEVVRPQPTRRLAASTQDMSWNKSAFTERIRRDQLEMQHPTSNSSPDLLRRTGGQRTSGSRIEDMIQRSAIRAQRSMEREVDAVDSLFQRISDPDERFPRVQPAEEPEQRGHAPHTRSFTQNMDDSFEERTARSEEIQESQQYQRAAESSLWDRPTSQQQPRRAEPEEVFTRREMTRQRDQRADAIKIDRKGRFVIPEGMVLPLSTDQLQRTPERRSEHQVLSSSSPALYRSKRYEEIAREERVKEAAMQYTRPRDRIDQDTEVSFQGMNISPSSPSFHRRKIGVSVSRPDEARRARPQTLSTSTPSLQRPLRAGEHDSRRRSEERIPRGLIKQEEIEQMQRKMRAASDDDHLTGGSDDRLMRGYNQQQSDRFQVTQSLRDLDVKHKPAAGLDFLDEMFAHRSRVESEPREDVQVHREPRDIGFSTDEEPDPPRRGYSRSVDSVQHRPGLPHSESGIYPRAIALSSAAVVESQPNIRGKPVDYVLQKQFMDDTVPYILDTDVIQEKEQAAEREGSWRQSRRTPPPVPARRGKKSTKYVLHCRSFYDDAEPFISSEDVTQSINDTDEAKMRRHWNLQHRTEQQHVWSGAGASGLEPADSAPHHWDDSDSAYAQKVTNTNSFPYLLTKRAATAGEAPAPFSLSHQHLPSAGHASLHHLDDAIRDLMHLSMPDISYIPKTLDTKGTYCLETLDVPEDRIEITSIVDTSPRKPVTEYFIRRDNEASRNGLESGDVIQKIVKAQDDRDIYHIARHIPAQRIESTITEWKRDQWGSIRRRPDQQHEEEEWNLRPIRSDNFPSLLTSPPQHKRDTGQRPVQSDDFASILLSPPQQKREARPRQRPASMAERSPRTRPRKQQQPQRKRRSAEQVSESLAQHQPMEEAKWRIKRSPAVPREARQAAWPVHSDDMVSVLTSPPREIGEKPSQSDDLSSILLSPPQQKRSTAHRPQSMVDMRSKASTQKPPLAETRPEAKWRIRRSFPPPGESRSTRSVQSSRHDTPQRPTQSDDLLSVITSPPQQKRDIRQRQRPRSDDFPSVLTSPPQQKRESGQRPQNTADQQTESHELEPEKRWIIRPKYPSSDKSQSHRSGKKDSPKQETAAKSDDFPSVLTSPPQRKKETDQKPVQSDDFLSVLTSPPQRKRETGLRPTSLVEARSRPAGPQPPRRRRTAPDQLLSAVLEQQQLTTQLAGVKTTGTTKQSGAVGTRQPLTPEADRVQASADTQNTRGSTSAFTAYSKTQQESGGTETRAPDSESSDAKSEQSWDSFFHTLDAQNAQLYRVEGSNPDLSDDLDKILSGGYLNPGLDSSVPGHFPDLPEKSSIQIRSESESSSIRTRSLTRQVAVDDSPSAPRALSGGGDDASSSSSSSQALFTDRTLSDDEDSFDELFRMIEKEEEKYDNVPSPVAEEYDNVSAESPPNADKTEAQASKEFWSLRAKFAGQDNLDAAPEAMNSSLLRQDSAPPGNGAGTTTTHGFKSEVRKSDRPTPNPTNQLDRLHRIRGDVEDLLHEVKTTSGEGERMEGSDGSASSYEVETFSPSAATEDLQDPDTSDQMEKLNTIWNSVEGLLREVETLRRSIEASHQKRASSVGPTFRTRDVLSPEQDRSVRSRSWDPKVSEVKPEELLKDILKTKRLDTSTTPASRYHYPRQTLPGQYEPTRTDDDDSFPTSSEQSCESDASEAKSVKSPKSILKTKAGKHGSPGSVRFSDEHFSGRNGKKPAAKTKGKKLISSPAARTSPVGRSPPLARKLFMDSKESNL